MGQALHELLLQWPEARSPQQAAVLVVLLVVVCPLLVHLVVGRFGTTTAAATARRARQVLLSKLPSPPGRLPIIGHLHLVGSLPHVSLRDISAKHAGDGLMLLQLGAVPTLIISSPSAAQAVLRTQDHIFASRASSPVTDILFYGSTDAAFCPYGEHWRQVKKMCTTHLLSNRKVRSYRHAREQEVSLVVAKIHEAATAGTAVDLSDLLNSFTNDIVCHAVSGKFFREEGRNKLFRELVEANSSLLGGFNLEDYFPMLVKLDVIKRMVCSKARRVNKMWDDLLNKLIDDHIANKPERDGEESDFIDVLLSVQQEYNLAREHIKAQLVVMFQGGTDTGFIVLEYAMAELAQNPRLMSKLQAEVRTKAIPKQGKAIVTEDEVKSLPYLQAVIKETLRLHMPAPLLVPHLSMADCDIEGYTIPAGTRAIVNSWALARDPSYWERAEEFMPERFMEEEGGSAAIMDYKGADFLYLPFGTGRRICPGMNFATSSVEVMLANLVCHFDWELPLELADKGIDMTESFGVTVHRTEKLLLVPVVVQQDY
ncbi:hypothetical protein U9M48_001939 [Paspalum notatum var. saurae]|uniref:Uncharacterized protein n=1 Tax=Paspalum notatum var. saurae TaxID=547442 RepID=A0AAQ3PPS5_PASNO